MGQARSDCRDIFTGHIIPGSPESKFYHLGTNGVVYHTTAQEQIGSEFFLFWNPPGGPVTTDKSITMTLFPGSEATAWYGKKGPGKIVTRSFSDGENRFLTQTPIASVDPASAWSGGNSEDVSNSTSVTLTAKDSIAGDSGETFDGWLQFGEGVISGATLTVPAGESCYAIAFYRNHKIIIPTTNRRGQAYVTLIMGGTPEDGPGSGHAGRVFIRVGPGPGDPGPLGTRAEQDVLVGLSLNEIGNLVDDPGVRAALKKLGVELAQNALARLNADEPAK